MIRTGIIGDSRRPTRELMRLLIHHPDVDIKFLTLEGKEGQKLNDLQPEFTGENEVTVKRPDLRELDMLFVAGDATLAAALLTPEVLDSDIKIVDLTGEVLTGGEDVVPALCELYRKNLVREGKHATVPSPEVMAVATPLLPFARNLLLNNPISATIIVPEGDENDNISQPRVVAELLNTRDKKFNRRIKEMISELQQSFEAPITTLRIQGSQRRGVLAVINFDCTISEAEMHRMFDEFFDDHNFIYRIGVKPEPGMVENTNKCLVNITNREGNAMITLAFDDRVKGGAGTAVHAMNLMFKLHERVGLDLKNSR